MGLLTLSVFRAFAMSVAVFSVTIAVSIVPAFVFSLHRMQNRNADGGEVLLSIAFSLIIATVAFFSYFIRFFETRIESQSFAFSSDDLCDFLKIKISEIRNLELVTCVLFVTPFGFVPGALLLWKFHFAACPMCRARRIRFFIEQGKTACLCDHCKGGTILVE